MYILLSDVERIPQARRSPAGQRGGHPDRSDQRRQGRRQDDKSRLRDSSRHHHRWAVDVTPGRTARTSTAVEGIGTDTL